MTGPRVIAGKAKGRRLQMVPGCGTRPIGDRPKEALFNILRSLVKEAYILDLFAGTGSVGIEALSRGAAQAVFLDINHLAIKTIHANLELTGFKEDAIVLKRDAFTFLELEKERKFDLVYVAPPQYKKIWERAVVALDESIHLLYPDGWVIVQIHPEEYSELELMHLKEFDQRRYGNTLLVFYELPGDLTPSE
jgi:16S rRNA (guanine(966)-N(2))-methyltransferase RsmD